MRPSAATVSRLNSGTRTTWATSRRNVFSMGRVATSRSVSTAPSRASSQRPTSESASRIGPLEPESGAGLRPVSCTSSTRSPAAKPLTEPTGRLVDPAVTSVVSAA